MTPAETTKLVQDVLAGELNWRIWLLTAAPLFAAALGAWSGAYLKKHAEQSAQIRFSNELLMQVKAQTVLVKEIESGFGMKLATFSEGLKLQTSAFQEFLKQQLARETLDYQYRVSALGDLAKLVGACSHCICWTSWIAKNSPDALAADDMKNYDKQMNELLGKMVGARVVLAGLSPAVHDALSKKIDQLFDLDQEAARASNLFRTNPDASRSAWAQLYQKSQDYDAEFLNLAVELAPQMKM